MGQVSGVRCQVLGVRCQVSDVRCQVSLGTCHLSLTLTATDTDPPPANSPTMHRRLICQEEEKDIRTAHTQKLLEVCQY